MALAATGLIRDIRLELSAGANPDIAESQQAYIKSALPFYGLKVPEVRKVVKPLIDQHTLQSAGEWERAIRTLWDGASHREEWFAALCIARHGRYRAYRTSLDALSLYDHLIRTGAWWDVCDEIAHHLVGEVLLTHREQASPVMRTWSTDDNLWIRRCSILSQNTHKGSTDPGLLRDCILPSMDDPNVFARKAIGWALRNYARIDPAWVTTFVEEFDDRLSGFSKREALRNISG